MFASDALRALSNGNLSDLELSLDDEDVGNINCIQNTRSAHLGSVIINQNQREHIPPESDNKGKDEKSHEPRESEY